MIRVLIADSYPIVRSGLKQVLSQTNEIQVIGETASHMETLRKVQTTNCQLLVLSADLLGNILEFLTELKRLRPDIRILLFSVYSNIELGVRSLKSGASGYINIQSTADELVRAVRWVADGRKYICAEIAERTNRLCPYLYDTVSHKQRHKDRTLCDRQ